MTSRLLIVPAAGLGTRLGADRPKLLVPVAGMPMIDRLLTLFARAVDRAVVIVHPSGSDRVGEHLVHAALPVTTEMQHQPSGMLDAIMLADRAVRDAQPDEVWIVWCDQVAIHPATIQRLAQTLAAHPDVLLALPTVERRDPYIHLRRDAHGTIDAILHRREGDSMPETGESDMGLFALSRTTYLDLLPSYAREVSIGSATGERNFLPFIAWLGAGRHGEVVTFPAVHEMEAVGVNTPDELQRVERYLIARESTVR
jgi:bifunctional UDP-N-acetylglucosamine pyrophosphorylase / glucosamine-1-phosphate N-acetyltransferase